MHLSPWHVKSLQDFTFICCPECDFKSPDPIPFECHALENHPSSKEFFHIDKAIVVLDSKVIYKYESEQNLYEDENSFSEISIKEETTHNKEQDPLFVDQITNGNMSSKGSSRDDNKHNSYSHHKEESKVNSHNDTTLPSVTELFSERDKAVKEENENGVQEIKTYSDNLYLPDWNDQDFGDEENLENQSDDSDFLPETEQNGSEIDESVEVG